MTGRDSERAGRLAEALRENLKRRKAQARAVSKSGGSPPEPSRDQQS